MEEENKTLKFTILLRESEVEKFDKIQTELNLKSRAATVRELLSIYEKYVSVNREKTKLNLKIQDLEKDIKSVTADKQEIKDKLKDFFSFLSDLQR